MVSGNIDADKKKIVALREKIRHHDYMYYVESNPEISDQSYDALYKELVNIESKYPQLITSDSPTQRVADESLKGFVSVKHQVPMLSMDNTYSNDEIIDFNNRIKKLLVNEKINYVVELKIDGVSVSLRYENGSFTRGATRGDGYKGDDVTRNLKTIKSIPLSLLKDNDYPFGEILEVRGEVFLPRKVFLELNKIKKASGEAPFANPRNAASGSLKLLDAKEVSKRNLDIFIWGLGYIRGYEIEKHSQALEIFKHLGFKINPYFKICDNIDEVISYCDSFKDRKKDLEYDVDGMVIKVDSLSAQKRLGATTKSPRWLIAYKFPATRVETVLKDIVIQVGRTGILTPVAIVESVFVSGSLVTKASLHNEDQIKRLDVRIQDHVLVEKAGEIIPQIVDVLKDKRSGKERPFKMPVTCPICNGKVVRLDTDVALRCVNPFCAAQVKNSIRHFASRNAMDIEGLGEKVIDQLVDTGILKDYADIYFLNQKQLANLERMGEKSSQNIIKAIQKSKKQPLQRLIYALGIRHVGVHVALVLTERLKSLQALMAASFDELENISEIGPTIAESVIHFFSLSRVKDVIKKIQKSGLILVSDTSKVSGKLKGLSFVITGTLSYYSRVEMEEIIKSNGGRVSQAVSNKTSYLILGKDMGSKYKKAMQLGVKIITEKELNEMLKKGR